MLYCIASFDTVKNFRFVNQLIAAAADMCEDGFDLSIAIFTATTRREFEELLPKFPASCNRTNARVPIDVRYYPRSIKFRLTGQHRDYMAARLDQFDVFLYTEDDILLKPKAVRTYLKHCKLLGDCVAAVPGFLRVEQNISHTITTSKRGVSRAVLSEDAIIPGSPENRFVHWENSEQGWKAEKVNGVVYVQPEHPYQAMWIATGQQLLRWNATCSYLTTPQDAGNYAHFANDLIYREWAACLQLFESCSVRKMVPLGDDFDQFLVHHLSDKTHLPPTAPIGGYILAENLHGSLKRQFVHA
jgi:hypothetical protein